MNYHSWLIVLACLAMTIGCAAPRTNQPETLNPQPETAASSNPLTSDAPPVKTPKPLVWAGWVLVQATLDSAEPRRILLLNDMPGDTVAEFNKPAGNQDLYSWPVQGKLASLFLTKLYLKEQSKSPPILMATINPLTRRKYDCEMLTREQTALVDTADAYQFESREGTLWLIYKLSTSVILLKGPTSACTSLAEDLNLQAGKPARF